MYYHYTIWYCDDDDDDDDDDDFNYDDITIDSRKILYM